MSRFDKIKFLKEITPQQKRSQDNFIRQTSLRGQREKIKNIAQLKAKTRQANPQKYRIQISKTTKMQPTRKKALSPADAADMIKKNIEIYFEQKY